MDAEAVDQPTWDIISRCVSERGALLVLVAGPRAMPHAISSPTGRALVPAEVAQSRQTLFGAGGDPFRWALTQAGQRHPATQQGAGDVSNEQVWAGFPEIRWRHPVSSIKEGAEVLLVASTGAEKPRVASAVALTDALGELANRSAREAESALLVTRHTGKGRVALLLTDRTWRLREGAGDIFHHRFWGNLVRWGAGPVLRAGGTRVRMGTDQLTYTPDDRPLVTARLRDSELLPVDDPSLRVEVLHDGAVVATAPMTAVKDSHGLFEATLDRITTGGGYSVRLRGDRAEELVREDGADTLTAGFRVVGSRGPIELAETTLNLPLLETIAQLSGGKVVSLDETGELASLFQSDKNAREEIRETSLWDNGWTLALMAGLLAAEWIARRTGGLP